MPILTISGKALAVAGDPASDVPLRDPQELAAFHGLHSEECVCESEFDTPPLADRGLRGGTLRFVFEPASSDLRISTSYFVPERLDERETTMVMETTVAQWSDGLGSGVFINHGGEVLSTAMAMAIRNMHGEEAELGEFFVDAFPVVEDRAIRIEWSDEGDPDDDRIKDMTWSADQGFATAQLLLACHLEQGASVAQDLPRAFQLYKAAADQGLASGCFHLANCYAEGIGTQPDLTRALELYKAAAEGGHSLAMGLVGHFFEQGQGAPADLAEAARWYRRGAEAGNIVCLAQLAECYEMGRGLDRDLHRALTLYQDCYDQGFRDVEEAIERVKRILEL